MFLLREIQTFLGAALPLLVQVGVIYLILRFTFAVSNVLVRLATLMDHRRPAYTEAGLTIYQISPYVNTPQPGDLPRDSTAIQSQTQPSSEPPKRHHHGLKNRYGNME